MVHERAGKVDTRQTSLGSETRRTARARGRALARGCAAAMALGALTGATACGGRTTMPSADAGISESGPAGSAPGAVLRPGHSGPKLSVLTYNVNYGLGGDPEGVAAIADADADLVLLQETTPEWADAIRCRLAESYPHIAFHDCCVAGGMGVLSKHPFVPKEIVHAERAWFPAWRLVVNSPLGPLQVLNVHLHPQISESGSVVRGIFTTPFVREAEIAEYAQLLDPALPTLVAGDFNESREGAAIKYLGRRGFRSALAESPIASPTWRWQTSLGMVAAELDHVVHDERLSPLEVRVLRVGRSDHFPVLAVFGAPTSPDS